MFNIVIFNEKYFAFAAKTKYQIMTKEIKYAINKKIQKEPFLGLFEKNKYEAIIHPKDEEGLLGIYEGLKLKLVETEFIPRNLNLKKNFDEGSGFKPQYFYYPFDEKAYRIACRPVDDDLKTANEKRKIINRDIHEKRILAKKIKVEKEREWEKSKINYDTDDSEEFSIHDSFDGEEGEEILDTDAKSGFFKEEISLEDGKRKVVKKYVLIDDEWRFCDESF